MNPTSGLRRSWTWSKNTCFTDEKKTSPCVLSKRTRLFWHHAHTCFNMCARGAGTHGDVLNVHTETRWVDTRSFEACHTLTHTHTHINTQHTQYTAPQRKTTHYDHNTTRRRERQRQTETEKEDRDRETREDGREEKRQEKRRQKEDKTRQENREDSFSVWWCMAVFCWCSDFLVEFRLRSFLLPTKQCQSTTQFRFQCPLAGQQIFNYLRIIFSMLLQFLFF